MVPSLEEFMACIFQVIEGVHKVGLTRWNLLAHGALESWGLLLAAAQCGQELLSCRSRRQTEFALQVAQQGLARRAVRVGVIALALEKKRDRVEKFRRRAPPRRRDDAEGAETGHEVPEHDRQDHQGL